MLYIQNVFSAATFGVLVAAAPAYAAVDARSFIQSYDAADPSLKRLYERVLGATEDGMSWSNAALKNQGKEMLFCEPPNLVLQDQQIIDILRREISDEPRKHHPLQSRNYSHHFR